MASQSPQVTSASAQDGRPHQEDRWLSEPVAGGYLLAVFDGHGGTAVAEKASQEFIPFFEAAMESAPEDIPKVLQNVFARLNQTTYDEAAGSTVSAAFIPLDAQQVYIAVLGDSPIALLDSDGKTHVGPNHNIRTNLKECLAAQALGGIFCQGYLEDPHQRGRGLQMTRSLGDAELARVLNREPEIETIALGGKGTVLVGTDGLFLNDGEPNAHQLTRLLQRIQQGDDAQALVEDALARKTGDNVTALVWKA